MGDLDDSAALRRRLNESLKVAFKARNETAVAAIRSAIAAIDNPESAVLLSFLDDAGNETR
jgi:uncharacterized protein YqeY